MRIQQLSLPIAVLAALWGGSLASDAVARDFGGAVEGYAPPPARSPAAPPPAVLPPPGTAAATPQPAAPSTGTRRVTNLLRSGRKHFVSAHRGDYRVGEGNSMQAFRRAAAAGVDFIEIDVETTSDGVPVVAHDPWPRGKTFAAWQRQRRRLLPLATVLRWSASYAVPILILDLKTPSIDPVARVLKQHRTAGRVILFTTDETKYHRVRYVAPSFDVMVRARTMDEARRWIQRHDPRIALIHGDYEWMVDFVVREIHEAGYRVFANSYRVIWHKERLGASDSANRLFRRGIDVAQTNHPPSAVALARRLNRSR